MLTADRARIFHSNSAWKTETQISWHLAEYFGVCTWKYKSRPALCTPHPHYEQLLEQLEQFKVNSFAILCSNLLTFRYLATKGFHFQTEFLFLRVNPRRIPLHRGNVNSWNPEETFPFLSQFPTSTLGTGFWHSVTYNVNFFLENFPVLRSVRNSRWFLTSPPGHWWGTEIALLPGYTKGNKRPKVGTGR